MVKWETKIGVVYTYETQDKLKLFDSDKEYIGYVGIENKSTNEILELINELLNIEHISDLVDLGYGLNMMFANDKEDLEDMFVKYDFECKEEDYQEYIETHTSEEYEELIKEYDLPINRVGDDYFIMDYTEF